MLLVVAADELLDIRDGLGSDPIVEVLDTLLLLFIVVELLSAVRTTVAKRELLAEPFLLVGIIASIKEIVVLSVKAAEDIGKGSTFRDQLWEIGVLGVVVLLLGTTAWLLRVKEREPAGGHARLERGDRVRPTGRVRRGATRSSRSSPVRGARRVPHWPAA